MKRFLKSTAVGLALGLLLSVTTTVMAQSGPYSAQIQRALASFITTAHTWTALQTFSGGISGGATFTADKFCVNNASADAFIGRVGTTDLGIYTGACSGAGTLRFDVSATAVTSTLNVFTTKIFCGTNDTSQSCDPAGWGARNHVSVVDNSTSGNGQPVAQFINNANDAGGVAVATLDFVFPAALASHKEIAQLYIYTDGGTATKRGGRFSFFTKRDNSTTLEELLRLDAAGDVFQGSSCPQSAGNGRFGFLNGPFFRCTSTTQAVFSNNGETAGVVFDVGTNGTLDVFQSDGSTQGIVKTGTVNAVTAFQVNATPITQGTTHLSAGSGMAVANVGANSCGTTAASIAGNNNAFVITVGATSGTQCRVAFTFAATTEWDCAANDDTTTVAVRTTPVDTTHTDLIGTFTAGDKVTGICFPR